MATQSSPHPRIISAYARETWDTQRLLTASHQRSNSLPLAKHSRGRHNSNPVPYRQGSAQTPCTSVDAYIDHQFPRKPDVSQSKWHWDQDNLDTASITAVKSREMLKLKKTRTSDGRLISSLDEMVISSWGGGRKRCLDTLLDIRGQHEDMHVQSFDLSTPPASRFPLPPVMSRADLTDRGKQRPKIPRRHCSSLLSEVPQRSWTMDNKVRAFHHFEPTAPLMIRKKAGVDYSGGTIGDVSNSTRPSPKSSTQPSAGAASRAFDTEVGVIRVDPGFRATRCPPSIKGNPRNRI